MLQEILQQSYFGNTLFEYAAFLAVFLIGVIIAKILKYILLKRLKTWSEKFQNNFGKLVTQIVEKHLLPLRYFFVFYLSIQLLNLAPALDKGINSLALILLTLFAVRFILTTINFGLETYWVLKEKDQGKKNALKGILTLMRFAIWGLAIILLLDNFGIKISALVAGLGIGGIAIALAAQAVLGDVFSYFTIFFDRPFEVGDFIIVDDCLGAVEYIGIKTTRISSLSGEQIVFSNTDLTSSRIRNYKKMYKRRVAFKIGVTYETKHENLKELPKIIEDLIKNIKDTMFDRAHFFEYGDFSLNFEIVYYVIGNDYNKYMDIQQEINLKIKEEFDKRQIEFAYPTQTVLLNKP